MKGQFINLTDGSRIEAKVNFGTLYYLQKIGGSALAKRLDKKKKQNKHITEDEQMEFTAKVVYAILRSNGKEVTFDEALMLTPPDLDNMQAIADVYKKGLEDIKKKQESKNKMRNFAQK